MKIKIGEAWGTDIARDLRRVEQLRELAGTDVELMVDANGGYTRGQARRVGAALDDLGVVWFEEPVSSDDPPAWPPCATRCAATSPPANTSPTPTTPHRLCRGGGLPATGRHPLRRLHRIAAAAPPSPTRTTCDVSAHCAPALHAPVAAAVPNLRHIEWFTDHARLEPLLVDGAPVVRAGQLTPQTSNPGHGMSLRPAAAFRIH